MGRDNWATATIKEAPYWCEGMTPKQYEEEREYYLKNYDDIRAGKLEYVPLNKRKSK